jgi:hypothetical protein
MATTCTSNGLQLIVYSAESSFGAKNFGEFTTFHFDIMAASFPPQWEDCQIHGVHETY